MTVTMTAEEAYAVLGVPAGSDFSTTAKAFRELRDRYDPAVNPHRRREYAEVLAAFEFLQRLF
jgi:DnaJ-class molecular chaperone